MMGIITVNDNNHFRIRSSGWDFESMLSLQYSIAVQQSLFWSTISLTKSGSYLSHYWNVIWGKQDHKKFHELN